MRKSGIGRLIRILGFGLLLLGYSMKAQVPDFGKLDQYLDTLGHYEKFMGSIAISQNGKIVYRRAIGFADVAANKAADLQTRYRIGSISKTFTTLLIMQAVEEGKLKLDQTLNRFFPWLKNGERITINHLLHHRSGLHNFTDDPAYMTYHTEAMSRNRMEAVLADLPSDFEPGSRAAYSNSNFVLLTLLLEDLYAKPYADLVEEHLCKPLHLKDTYVGRELDTNNRECRSYRRELGWVVEPETHPSIPLGAGALVSTPSDLVAFSDALFGGKILQEKQVLEMRSLLDGYGKGLFLIPFYEKQGYGHTGGIDGFRSVFSWFAEGGISFAICSNGSAINPNDISVAVLSVVFGKPFEWPNFNSFTPDAAVMPRYAGTYISNQLPLKITVTFKDNILKAQATGQAAFPLEAMGPHTFGFAAAGVVMVFDPDKQAMELRQGSGIFSFRKE